MDSPLLIKLINKSDRQILNTFPYSEMEKAYLTAEYYEQIGLDVTLEIPGAAHFLASSLKVEPQEFTRLTDDMDREIKDHDDGPPL